MEKLEWRNFEFLALAALDWGFCSSTAQFAGGVFFGGGLHGVWADIQADFVGGTLTRLQLA